MISLRPMAIWAAFVALLVVSLIVSGTAAIAGDGTTVDFSPTAALVREYLMVVIDVLISGVAGLVLRWLHLAGNSKAEDLAVQARDHLHATALRGFEWAEGQIKDDISSVDVKSEIIASALTYVQSNARGAIKRLGASPDEVRLLLEGLFRLTREKPGAASAASPAGGLVPAAA
ncbi:hypothetical protein [Inquilinus sp. OTU3971]|uniref:hypothetical protein n=1 Tax=Inquilinus sp. OTU3971 TaxID=3043855 RepID=UPI00313C87DF